MTLKREYTLSGNRKGVPAFIISNIIHDLRHSYADASICAGDTIKTVQENLGHATAAFTLDVYSHLTEHMQRDSANRMQKFIQNVSR